MMYKSAKRSLALVMIMVFTMALVLNGCGSKSSKKLYVGMEVGYPPMEMVSNTDGETVEGFDVDVAREVAKRLGKEDIEIVNTAWDGIFAALETKKYDCIVSAVSITKERQDKYALTKPYVANKLVLVTKKGDTSINSPSDLSGKKVGLQSSTTAEDYVKNELIAKGKKVDYAPYQKVTQPFSELKIGRIDAVMVDLVVAGYYMVQDKKSFQIAWESSDAEPMGICFRKDDKERSEQVNGIIDEMKEDGTLAKISKKWFSIDITRNLE